MSNSWFGIYHKYSTSDKYDKRGLNQFKIDVEFARKLGVKFLIMEDYYKNLNWGEYTTFWNRETLERMISLAHENDIKFIPYIDCTELTIRGEKYKKFGRKWGAKNRWGKIFSGFNSIFLPLAYPKPYEFFTKIMCPKSGWQQYLISQVDYLLNELPIDGIYMDRVDYRLACYDHKKDSNHFNNGIAELVENIVKKVKDYDDNYITIMNDSCMQPDDIMKKCIKAVDFVLSELLPVDWDPNSIYNRISREYGDLAWYFRRFLKPLFCIITEMQFTSKSMINVDRIKYIVHRLAKNIKTENIFLFSHRKDLKGLETTKKVVSETGANICYFTGLKRLISLKNQV
ncbi:MAG: hypothetical protein EU549_02540 [Promethearchaeota archaeon]|nr:MAG: hypothetical protein EU549_02540 [Candidatus Lokiarchaeota archaeon]